MQPVKFRRLGTEMLFYYIKYEQTEEVLGMLHRHEVEPDDQDINGNTSLHIAVEQKLINQVKLLLSLGANPNIPDYLEVGYNTPLHKAAEANEYDIVTLLVSAGADLNARNKLGQTPLHISFRKKNGEISRYLLSHGRI
jgi:ankyrin repeat protein